MPTTRIPARAAVRAVLLETGKPMHYRDIASLAVKANLVRVRGKPHHKADPEATMKTVRSYLCSETLREDSEFMRVDTGVYRLKPSVIAAAKMEELARARLRAAEAARASAAKEKSS